MFKLVRICEATGDKEKLERYMDTFRQAAKHLVFQIQSIVIRIQCIVVRIQRIVIRIIKFVPLLYIADPDQFIKDGLQN